MLFHKRTKRFVKVLWGILSVIIVLSMVVVYSGFTMLAHTAPTANQAPPTDPGDVPVDIQALVDTQNASGSIELSPDTAAPPAEQPTQPAPTPAQPLNFSL